MERFDAIVIGTGQGGVPLAEAFAAAGKRTAIIERDAVGGTCINCGCTPSKTLVHIAKVAETVRRAGDYGVITSKPKIDMLKVRKLKRGIVEEFRSGTESGLQKTKHLELIFGTARFLDAKAVEIELKEGGTRQLHASTIVINTGGRPAVPPVPGLDSIKYLDSTSVMELDHVPKSIAILGGGYIGLEFGQMLRRLGSKVIVLEHSPRFLPMEDEDVSDEILKILREDGIDVRLAADVKSVASRKGKISIDLGSKRLKVDEFLVAAGRKPNTEELNLDAAGVKTQRGYIVANGELETSAVGVYVIGDVKGGPAFTHISYDDYRVLKANLLDGEKRSIEGRLVPYTVFIDPELGRIGLSEDQAKEKKVSYRAAKMPMSNVARADEMGETRGFVKALIADDGKILGAAVLGAEGGEIMSMIELAMMGGLTAKDLNNAIFAHPTMSELLNNLFA
jgi:pyruvate/2-oxoglutarate dehydrogenase complex dihydrolipoamide dehydrogenase (E3) component